MSATGMWVEKYRPTKLSEIVNQTEIIGSLEALIKDPTDMPHLLFSGSAGVGKTTTALCLSRQILGEYVKDYTLELNASDERGIDMVREKVKKFSRFAGMVDVPFKIIILDEADEMTSAAQTALRRIIEDAAKICRFILIANNVSKIIDPIQSRCAAFKFTAVSEEDVIARLEEIAKKEKVKVDKKGLKEICEYAEGDLRHSINLMQATASLGGITQENVKASAGLTKTSDVDGVLKMALSGKVAEAREKMIELIKVYGMSESDFLKYFNSTVFKSKHDKLSDILQVIAKYDYRILVGANSEIQLSAMLAELAKLEN
ncbi:MAG: replication factor C small subunit [Nitrosopumilus sp.]|nr:replication factor C small subunit [Nitrosopumilus sp.]